MLHAKPQGSFLIMASWFHIYLSSRDSLTRFPGNTAFDFYCQLPEEINLVESQWWCALKELVFSQALSNTPLYLCCNICDDSIVGENKLPVLTCVNDDVTQPRHVTFVRVKASRINIVHLYLTDHLGRKVSFPANASHCTLVFRNNEALPFNA